MAQPRRDLASERGFTLPEVLIVIALMGILFAIASSSWFGVIESRRVDTAANQLASDLRLAHTRATNRLQDWQVALTSGSSTYTIGPAGSPATRSLPDGAVSGTDAVITFSARGSASPAGGGTITVRVQAVNNASNSRDIEVNAATSRVKIIG